MDYYIHDNGGRPFKVTVNGTHVDVYKRNGEWEGYENEAVVSFDCQRVFIGKSPLNAMTEFSGGHGPDFDGNTILLDLGGGEYVYIGGWIKKFKCEKEIVEYISHVGNNDVPYPYAIDSNGEYYLIIEDVIVSGVPEESKDEPYTYYYHKHYITAQIGRIPVIPPVIKDFQGITDFYIGKDPYMMTYKPDGGKDYDGLIKGVGSPICVYKTDGERYELDRESYSQILADFGVLCGFRGLEVEILVRRAGW